MELKNNLNNMERTLNFRQFFESNKRKDLKVIDFEIPNEVKKTTINILKGLFDTVKDIYFHSTRDGMNFVEFSVNDEDFKYVDEEEDLGMEMSPSVKKKRLYDVTLKYHEKVDETNNLIYEVTWTDMVDLEDEETDEEIDELDELPDDKDWYNPSDDEDVIDDGGDDIINNDVRKVFPDDEYIPGSEKFDFEDDDDIDL